MLHTYSQHNMADYDRAWNLVPADLHPHEMEAASAADLPVVALTNAYCFEKIGLSLSIVVVHLEEDSEYCGLMIILQHDQHVFLHAGIL